MRAILAALGLALVLGASVASAQSSGLQDRAADHAEKGLDAFDAGQYEEAIAHFERAESFFHAPTHLSFMGRANEKLGRLATARRVFKRLAEEPLPENPSAAFKRAQADARTALASLEERVPRISVVVEGASPEQVELNVDGTPHPSWQTEPIWLEIGDHEIVARADGFEPASTKLTLSERQHEEIALTLKPLVAAAPAPGPPSPTGGDDSDGELSLVPPLVAFGLGAAGLVVGGVTGGLSFSKVAELDDVCPTKQCNAEDQHLADEAETLGTVSTIGFIVGGVGVAAGAVLLFWQPFTSDGGEAVAGLRIGVGSVAVGGSF